MAWLVTTYKELQVVTQPVSAPCDWLCDSDSYFWNFWYFENFVFCITYLFSLGYGRTSPPLRTTF